MATEVIMTDWIFRKSSILRRWKKNWFVLYADGNLSYYQESSQEASQKEGNYSIIASCKQIKTALECGETNLPEERLAIGCLITLVSSSGSDLELCATSNNQALAWKLVIEDFLRARSEQNRINAARDRQVITHLPNTVCCRRGCRRCVDSRGYRVTNAVYCLPEQGEPVRVLYDEQGKPYYVQPNTQQIIIVEEDDPYYYRRGDMFYGAAAGMMLGAALWSPFLWSPFFWF